MMRFGLIRAACNINSNNAYHKFATTITQLHTHTQIFTYKIRMPRGTFVIFSRRRNAAVAGDVLRLRDTIPPTPTPTATSAATTWPREKWLVTESNNADVKLSCALATRITENNRNKTKNRKENSQLITTISAPPMAARSCIQIRNSN